MKKITLLILLYWTFSCLQAQNYNPNNYQLENVTLSQQEKELYDLIMEYRQEQGLPKIPISKSLTYVAQVHAWDLQENQPNQGNCNLHSWSGQDSWTSCCYTPDHSQSQCMWDKPNELTPYASYGYEISHFHTSLTPQTAFGGWKGSPAHNSCMINEDNWKELSWNAIGIGIYGDYAHVWFGESLDSEVISVNDVDNSESSAQGMDIFQISNPNNPLGYIVFMEDSYMMVSGEKDTNGELKNVRNTVIMDKSGENYLSLYSNQDGTPNYLFTSDRVEVNFNKKGYKVKKDGNKIQKKDISYPEINNNLDTSPIIVCPESERSKLPCDAFPVAVLTGLTAAKTAMCLMDAGGIAATGGWLAVIKVGGLISNCGGAIQGMMDLQKVFAKCDEVGYTKGNNFEFGNFGASCMESITNSFSPAVGNFIVASGQIQDITVGSLVKKLEKPKNLGIDFFEGLATGCLEKYVDEFVKDNLPQVFDDPCSGGEIPQCFSVELEFKDGSNGNIKSGETGVMTVSYCKPKQPVVLRLVFRAYEGKAGKTEWVTVRDMMKALPEDETEGTFTLDITNTGASDCVTASPLDYSYSNNPSSTWVYPLIIFDGESYLLGKKYDDTNILINSACCGLFQYEVDNVKFSGNGAYLGEGEYCSYTVE